MATEATQSAAASPVVPSSPRWLWRAIVVAALALAFADNLHETWDRWGDPIVDCGRELDVPKQLAAGKTLYKDVRYWYGPLPPMFNAALYRAFGTSTWTLAFGGITSAALLSWLTYRTVRLFAPRAAAAGTVILFLYACAFSHFYGFNIFNFVMPYSFPATYGILLASASVYFLLRHTRSARRRDFLVSCGFLALASLCKLEVIFAAGVAHAAFIVAWLGAGRLRKWSYLLGYLGVVGVATAVYGYYYAQAGASLLQDNLFLPGNVAASAFTLEHSGLGDPAAAMREIGLSLMLLIGAVVVAAVAAHAERAVRADRDFEPTTTLFGAPLPSGVRRRPGASRDEPTQIIGVFAINAMAVVLVCVATYWVGFLVSLRGLPIVLLAAVSVVVLGWIVRPGRRVEQTAPIVLCVFGLAGLARIVLKCGAEHYGFYLIVPALAAMSYLFGRLVPDLISRGAARRTLAPCSCCAALLIALAVLHGAATRSQARLFYGTADPPRLRARGGSMPLLMAYRGVVDEAVRFLDQQPAGTTVVVCPQGAGIAFLAGCDNPLGVHTFLPIDFSGRFDEAATLDLFIRATPDYVLVTSQSVSEWGKRAFGFDYAQSIAMWLNANYRTVVTFRTTTYAIELLGKR